MHRHPNPRLVKIHRNYSVEDITRLYGAHRNTVRAWERRGLRPLDNRRPKLFLGKTLKAFLEARRRSQKCPLQPGEIYCVRCRKARHPAEDMADYEMLAGVIGNIVGICPVCETVIRRRVNRNTLVSVRGTLDVQFPRERDE